MEPSFGNEPTFQRTLTRIVALPVILLILLVALFLGQMSSLISAAQWVEHTDQVISKGYEVQSLLLEQQSSVRGYLLNGTQNFLEPYQRGKTSMVPTFDQIALLVVDNESQAQRVTQLRADYTQWLAIAENTVALRAQGGDYMQAVRQGGGAALMSKMRANLTSFIATEEVLRNARTRIAQRTTWIVIGSSIGALLLFGALLAVVLRRQIVALAGRYETALATVRAQSETLRVEREWFSGTLASIGDAVIATDTQGRVTFMNPVAQTLTGHQADAAQGAPLAEVFVIRNETTHTAVESPVAKVLRDGQVVGLANHTEVVRADGSTVPIDDSAAPIYDMHGTLLGVVLVFRDITARKQADDALRERTAILRAVTEGAADAIYVKDRQGHMLLANPVTLRVLGKPAEAVLGKTDDQYFDDPATAALIIANDRRVMQTGVVEVIEELLDMPDGTRTFLSTKSPYFDEQGKVIGLIGISTDISARKGSENALRASEQRYRDLADSMPLVVWTATPDGGLDYYNQRWFEYTGLTLAETQGWGWQPVLHPDDLQACLERWSYCVRTGETYEIEYRWKQAADGAYRWHLGRAAPIRDATNQIVSWVGTGTDIDDQKRLAEQFRAQAEDLVRATTQLEERNRELDQFAYVTSHDLKAPLRGIANLSQWIEEDLGEHATDDIRQQMELLRGRVHRMESLIDGILQYSRVGRTKSAAEPVDVATLLHDSIDLLAPPPDVQITVGANMPTLVTEKVPLQQVFVNLISNALKHHTTPERAQIGIDVRDSGDFYEFRVRDDGPGIAPQYHEKIFVIFQTLASRDKVEGSGLGLSLVKKIVESQRGRIWVESHEGQGAVFSFTWPKQSKKGR